jgi:MFS superfamily sulfate permease-like transporter
MESFFWFLSHPIHCLHMEKLLIFVGSFCILLFCQKCLSDFRFFFSGVFRVFQVYDNIICKYFLSFLFLLITVAKNSSKILNKSRESEHHCLIPDFIGNALIFSLFRTVLSTVLSYKVFIMLRYIPSIPNFFRA